MTTAGTRPAALDSRGSRSLRLAWWSLALYPVAFAGAFVVG